MENDPRLHPVSLNRANGEAERVGGLGFRESTKESAVNDTRETRIPCGEPFESVVEIEEHLRLIVGAHPLVVEGDVITRTAAFRRQVCARPIDEYVAHRKRREREKVSTISARTRKLIGKLEVGLVNEPCCRKRASARASLAKPAMSYFAKLLIRRRDDQIDRVARGCRQFRRRRCRV